MSARGLLCISKRRWLYFVILYQGFVPIALLIAVTSANVVQSLYIQWDVEMYHGETDTPANARTRELAQEIGQISYVFSDKTGRWGFQTMPPLRPTPDWSALLR